MSEFREQMLEIQRSRREVQALLGSVQSSLRRIGDRVDSILDSKLPSWVKDSLMYLCELRQERLDRRRARCLSVLKRIEFVEEGYSDLEKILGHGA